MHDRIASWWPAPLYSIKAPSAAPCKTESLSGCRREFAFARNRLSGSYSALTRRSRSKLPRYASVVRASSSSATWKLT